MELSALTFQRQFSRFYQRVRDYPAVQENIYRLDMKMEGESALAVSFEGRRQRAYANAEPTVIKIEGTCKLVEPRAGN